MSAATETTIRVVEHEHWAQVTREFIRDPNVSHIAFRVYVYILDRAGKEETAFPSMRLIAAETRMAKSSAQKAIAELEALGWLHVERSQRKDGSVHIPVNRYLIFKSLSATVPRDGTASIPRDGTAQYRQSVQKKNQSLSSHSSLRKEGGASLATQPKRKRDELWDTFTQIHGDPATKTERGKYNHIVKQLRTAKVTPDEYPSLVAAYVRKHDGLQPAAATIANRVGELRKYRDYGPVTVPDADEIRNQEAMRRVLE